VKKKKPEAVSFPASNIDIYKCVRHPDEFGEYTVLIRTLGSGQWAHPVTIICGVCFQELLDKFKSKK